MTPPFTYFRFLAAVDRSSPSAHTRKGTLLAPDDTPTEEVKEDEREEDEEEAEEEVDVEVEVEADDTDADTAYAADAFPFEPDTLIVLPLLADVFLLCFFPGLLVFSLDFFVFVLPLLLAGVSSLRRSAAALLRSLSAHLL